MRTALVTGVLGQDGSYLAELLRDKGYRVIGLDLAVPTAPFEGVEHLALDVCDAAAVRELISANQPAEIYHLAGQTSVARSFSAPVETFRGMTEGTLNILEATRTLQPSARVFVAGSGEAFGDTGGRPADEQTALRPLSPYAASKAAVAHLVATYRASFGLFACVAFFYNHESPRRPEHFVTRKIVRAACRIARGLERHLELGDTSVVRDWGWAPEYVAAAWQMLARDEAEDFVIATGESVALSDFVLRVFERLDLEAARYVVTNPALKRAAEIPVMRADPARALARLGWKASVHVDEVAARLVSAELERLDQGL